MNSRLTAMAALACSLVLTSAVAAGAAPSINLKSSIGTSSALLELARDGGGGGGGNGGGGGRGGGGGGGDGGHARGGGPDGGGAALKGGDGGPSGRLAGRNYGRGDGVKAGGGGDFKGGRSGRLAGKDWDGGDKNWDRGKDHGSKSRHGKNFRRFYGPDIFVYGDSYGYGDCGWLRRQAVITGSPYWWRRYQECLYYD